MAGDWDVVTSTPKVGEWEDVKVAEGRRQNVDGGTVDNIVRSLARGATFGFADELAAGIPAVGGAVKDWVTGEGPGFQQRYDENLQYERGRDKAYDQSNPVGSALGQMAGGIGTARAVPFVQPFGSATTPAVLGNTAVNAGLGSAVAGFGEGEGVGDRLANALVSGGIGAVAGPAMHGVFDIGQRFGKRALGAFGIGDPTATSERLIARALLRDKADDIGTRVASATDPEILADFAGRNTTALSALAARTPSDAAEMAERVTAMRREGRPDRIASVVENVFGGGAGDDVFNAAKQLDTVRKTAAAPLYEKAFAKPVTIQDARKVQRFVTDPIGQDALQKGMRVIELEDLAQGRLFDPEKFGITRSADSGKWIIDPDILDGKKAPSFRLMDAVKRGFDEIVEGFRDPTSGKLNLDQYGRAVNDVRAAYRGKLTEINPDYRDALKAWSDPSQSIDALRRGQSAFRGNRDTAKVAEALVGETDKQFYRLGAGRAVADMTSDPARAPGAVRRLVEDRQMQSRLRDILPDDNRAMLDDAFQRELRMARTDRIVAPSAGSQTMPLQAAAEDATNEPLIARMLLSGAQGGFGGMASNAGLALYRRGQGINSEVADQLGTRLFGTGKEAIAETIEAIKRRKVADEVARQLIQRGFGRAATGGAVGAALMSN